MSQATANPVIAAIDRHDVVFSCDFISVLSLGPGVPTMPPADTDEVFE